MAFNSVFEALPLSAIIEVPKENNHNRVAQLTTSFHRLGQNLVYTWRTGSNTDEHQSIENYKKTGQGFDKNPIGGTTYRLVFDCFVLIEVSNTIRKATLLYDLLWSDPTDSDEMMGFRDNIERGMLL